MDDFKNWSSSRNNAECAGEGEEQVGQTLRREEQTDLNSRELLLLLCLLEIPPCSDVEALQT